MSGELENEIGEMLEGYAPPSPAAPQEEAPIETAPVAPVSEAPVNSPEGEKPNVEEGKERTEKETSEQVPTVAKPAEEPAKEVKPPEPGQVPDLEVPPVTQVASVTPPVEPVAPVLTAEQQELIRLRAELTALREQATELAGKVVAGPVKPTLTPEQQEAERVKNANRVLNFVKSPEAYDEVFKTHENFNALLTSVVNTAISQALRMVPQVTTQYVDQQFTLRTAASEFYREHEDLIPHRQYVGFISNEVHAEHPDWDISEILKEAEKRTRERLKLPKTTVSTTPVVSGGSAIPGQPIVRNSHTVEANPGFVPGGGSRRAGGGSPLTGEALQIDELIS